MEFKLVLILNSHIWLVATSLYRETLDRKLKQLEMYHLSDNGVKRQQFNRDVYINILTISSKLSIQVLFQESINLIRSLYSHLLTLPSLGYPSVALSEHVMFS